jgi:hypothetical protein
MNAAIEDSQIACSECGKDTFVVWAASCPTLTGPFCPWCSQQHTEYPFCLYFGKPKIENGAWSQRQDVGFADIARHVETSLRWLVETSRFRRDGSALPEQLVSWKATLQAMIFHLYDYLHDPTWIPHWKARIEIIENAICRDKTTQALAELKNHKDFLQWRIDQNMQLAAQGLGHRQYWQLLRFKGLLAAWERGEAFDEFDIPAIPVNWELLEPSGDGNFWPKIFAYNNDLRQFIKERRDDSRLKILNDQKPNMVFCGRSGFDGYLVFIFDRGKIALLEGAFLGNALYVMPSSKWHELSKLSKTELLTSHQADVRRIVHPSTRWASTLRRHLVSWGIIGYD